MTPSTPLGTKGQLWARAAWSCALVAVLGLWSLSCGPTRTAAGKLGDPCNPTQGPGATVEYCADGLCVALDSSSGFCTRECSEDSKCPSDYKCEAAGRYGKICKKLTGCKTDEDCPAGHSCNPETTHCFINVSRTLCSPCQDVKQCPEGGACFTAIGSGEQFCTTACGAGDSCPLGFSCQEVPAGAGGALVKQCAPTTQSCNSGRGLCAPCKGDAECGGPFDLCVRNVVSGETFCGRDCDPKKNVCPAGTTCDPQTLTSAPNPGCPGEFSCTNIGQSDDPNQKGPFQCVPNSNTCRDYCDAQDELGQIRQCGLGQQCDTARKLCRPATDGRECSPCLDNDDCRKTGAHPENRCIVNDCPDCPFKGESFCATPCADDPACVRSFGPGFVCRPVTSDTGTRSYCIPQRGTCKSGLGRLGDSCTENGAQDCVAGVCLVAGNTTLCSLPCTKDEQCGDTRYRCCESSGAGYDCAPDKRAADGPKSGMGVCAPLGGLFGDDCSPGRPPCQTGTCLDIGTARVCTVPCDASKACPDHPGFACRKALSNNADGGVAEMDICFPNGGGHIGADCTFGPAACESALCIKKDSGPVCTVTCTDASQCPEGWGCAVVSLVDKRSEQVCLPPSVQ